MSSANGEAILSSTPEFSLLWIDDHPKAVDQDKRNIVAWFENKYGQMKLRIVDAMTVEEALEKMRSDYFELFVTDEDLGRNSEKGSDFVKTLRERRDLTDIVWYTRKARMPEEVKEMVSSTRFTYVVEGPLTTAIPDVIKSRVERFQKPTFLRGLVISEFIEMEAILNDFLTKYYEISETREDEFRTSILENSYVTFNSKVNALLMITLGTNRPKKTTLVKPPFQSFTRKDLQDRTDLLKKVESHRNNLAHCRMPSSEALQVFSMGETHTYSRGQIIGVLKKIKDCAQFITRLTGCLNAISGEQSTPPKPEVQRG